MTIRTVAAAVVVSAAAVAGVVAVAPVPAHARPKPGAVGCTQVFDACVWTRVDRGSRGRRVLVVEATPKRLKQVRVVFTCRGYSKVMTFNGASGQVVFPGSWSCAATTTAWYRPRTFLDNSRRTAVAWTPYQ